MADTPAAGSDADPASTDPNAPTTSPDEQVATPSVPDDAAEDEPLHGSADARTLPVKDPVKDPVGEHRRGMDRAKVKFGMWLIASCLGVYVLLSAVQWALQGHLSNAGPLTSTQDLLKLIATTALGFVFGRTTDNDKKD